MKNFGALFIRARANLFSVTPFILQTLLWPIMWIILCVFGKINILGKENTSGHKRGAIFAVNHSSQLDPILVPATLNPFSALMPMFFLSRERRFYEKSGFLQYVYGGFIFRIFGAYPVITIGSKDYERILEHHIRILGRGRSVCVFPEGGLNTTDGVGDGKPGVAYLLWKTGRPVIPVAIYGHKQMGPREFFARKHKLAVSYGKPITREELFSSYADVEPPTFEDLKAATYVVMSRIRDMYDEFHWQPKDCEHI